MHILRTSFDEEVRKLFNMIGCVATQVSNHGKLLWISTSGLGVSWLHVRLNFYPKYYSHNSYKLQGVSS